MREAAITGAILGILASAAAAQPAADSTLVPTTAGPVSGRTIAGAFPVNVWKGIPYAARPDGARRWRPPEPPEAWTEPRACLEFGPACPQLGARGVLRTPEPQEEDCLHLNVWAPAPLSQSLLPVMVWIHGGGMVNGAASMPFYDGAELAREGAVIVSINYRLGPFGFFAHPALTAESAHGASGNQGLLDQIQALRWVHDNIRAFGGDPGKVTVFGESAGAVSVCWLLASPLAQGLFHRAIAQSGTAARIAPDIDGAEKTGVRLARKLDIGEGQSPDEALVRLRAIPARRLIEVLQPTMLQPGAGGRRGESFGPCIDGYVVTGFPDALVAAGTFNRVPLLIGTNSGDGSVFVPGLGTRDASGFRRLVRLRFGDQADEILQLYPEDPHDPQELMRDLFTDVSFVAPARRLARSAAGHGVKVHLYHFDRVPPILGRRTDAAPHGLEIPYVFGTLPRLGYGDEDRALSRTMRACWVRFAATGDPNGGGFPEWPAFTRENDAHLQLSAEITIGHGLRHEACDLLDRIGGDPGPNR